MTEHARRTDVSSEARMDEIEVTVMTPDGFVKARLIALHTDGPDKPADLLLETYDGETMTIRLMPETVRQMYELSWREFVKNSGLEDLDVDVDFDDPPDPD